MFGLNQFNDAIETQGISSNNLTQLAAVPGTANTKTIWTQVVSDIGASCSSFILILQPTSGISNVKFLIDIAIGATSSEQTIIANLFHYVETGDLSIGLQYFIPIELKINTAISLRYQCSSTSASVNRPRAAIMPVRRSFEPGRLYHNCDTYGADTSTTSTTAYTTSTTNTKTSWVEIISSTTRSTKLITIIIHGDTTGASNANHLLDIGIGGSGSEVTLITNLSYRHNITNTRQSIPRIFGPFPVNIPSGTRLSVRGQSDVSTQKTWVELLCFG